LNYGTSKLQISVELCRFVASDYCLKAGKQSWRVFDQGRENEFIAALLVSSSQEESLCLALKHAISLFDLCVQNTIEADCQVNLLVAISEPNNSQVCDY
jgi:hypothetical protein